MFLKKLQIESQLQTVYIWKSIAKPHPLVTQTIEKVLINQLSTLASLPSFFVISPILSSFSLSLPLISRLYEMTFLFLDKCRRFSVQTIDKIRKCNSCISIHLVMINWPFRTHTRQCGRWKIHFLKLYSKTNSRQSKCLKCCWVS